MDLIHGLLGLGRKDEIVQQLIVSGKDEDDHADIINLLKEGLTSEEKVEIDGRRTLSYQARLSAAIRAWESRVDEIREMFNEKSLGESHEALD